MGLVTARVGVIVEHNASVTLGTDKASEGGRDVATRHYGLR
jgi:hypothetical protein